VALLVDWIARLALAEEMSNRFVQLLEAIETHVSTV